MAIANDCSYVLAPALEQLFRDKDTGLPLSNGTVEFFDDNARTIQKPVFEKTGTPGNPIYIELPNPVVLNIAGAFDTAVYYNPYDDQGNVQLYFIEVKNSQSVLQFTREGYPDVCTDSDGEENISAINYIANPQWRMRLPLPAGGIVVDDVTNVGYGGWSFRVPPGFTSTNILAFETYTQEITNPEAHPPAAISVSCTNPIASEPFKDLLVEFFDVNTLAGEDVTFQVESKTNSTNLSVSVVIIQNYGSGGSPTVETVVGSFLVDTSAFNKNTISFTMPDNSGATIDSNVFGSSMSVVLRFPTSVLFEATFTNSLLVKGTFSSLNFPDYSVEQDASITLGGSIQIPATDGSDTGKSLVLSATTRPDGYSYPQLIWSSPSGNISTIIINSDTVLTVDNFNSIIQVDLTNNDVQITMPPNAQWNLGNFITLIIIAADASENNRLRIKGNLAENINSFNFHDFYFVGSQATTRKYDSELLIDNYYDAKSAIFRGYFNLGQSQAAPVNATAIYPSISFNQGSFYDNSTGEASLKIRGEWEIKASAFSNVPTVGELSLRIYATAISGVSAFPIDNASRISFDNNMFRYVDINFTYLTNNVTDIIIIKTQNLNTITGALEDANEYRPAFTGRLNKRKL